MGAGAAVCVCRVGEKAQGAVEVALVEAAIDVAAGMGCKGEEGDGEEAGQLHCGWRCKGGFAAEVGFFFNCWLLGLEDCVLKWQKAGGGRCLYNLYLRLTVNTIEQNK